MTNQLNKYSLTWDLDAFFLGGSLSEDFKIYMNHIKTDIKKFELLVSSSELKESRDLTIWRNILDIWQDLSCRLGEAEAYISCLIAQDMRDKEARNLKMNFSVIESAFNAALEKLDQLFLEMKKSDWEKMMNDDYFKQVSFPLKERREKIKELSSLDKENLIKELAIDGYHAWGDLYSNIISKITIPYTINGSSKLLSVGQAMNILDSSDRSIRQQIFHLLNDIWEREEDLIGSILNHLCGFRLNVYNQRGWSNPVKESLINNRISEETLLTMWDVINKNKKGLIQFLERKAKIIGVDKLAWYDVFAPLGKTKSQMSYEDAVDTIVKKLGEFDMDLSVFAEKVFQEKWIEAEDRPGKRSGAFCIYFSDSAQSRIFTTFSGSSSIVSVLAHEIGHAYHQYTMRDLPKLVQNCGLCLSETASMLTELIVTDSTICETVSKEQKILLLEEKIRQAVSCLLGIQARFLFETRLNNERKKGIVSAKRLKELTVQAQQDAFSDCLSEYHPWLWASRLHYYITEVPFYNYPYTFGYLFSIGIYKRYSENKINFSNQFIELLKSTGSMTAEELALKYLGVDLTGPEFWQDAIELIKDDINNFLELTE
ncbi:MULTISPECIES: M3 family oligoendopeptidase [Bacillus amyloliquefaciens group]|uniref:M3 family oligoendopeptidase n=1 Tax=Bacillus amyloliquefaciens group TaxID=1938374 RepID=UPI000C78C9A3|nr:M3 family oligoendopeptidase [Bacillus velezensis]AUJ61246.1 hypothetical protein B6257_11925 [Bacillus velezensis]